MKVKELIEKLSELPPEAEVLCNTGDGNAATPGTVFFFNELAGPNQQLTDPGIVYLTDYEGPVRRFLFE